MIQNKQLRTVITCVTVLSILFLGMRVPDISRPHRHKPTNRAVIDKQVKAPQSAVKKSVEIVAISIRPVEISSPVFYRSDFQYAFQPPGYPHFSPNAPRAPPLFIV